MLHVSPHHALEFRTYSHGSAGRMMMLMLTMMMVLIASTYICGITCVGSLPAAPTDYVNVLLRMYLAADPTKLPLPNNPKPLNP